MMDFQYKINRLRQSESICYTICLKLLQDEQQAAKAAEWLLMRLFADEQFWKTSDSARDRYIFRIASNAYLNQSQMRSFMKTS
ncbi:hypothetical protein [Paenibacillus sp. Leaf72]|uniref:hypothetical protein n=1 Tax=Paenibacillus sp. Leaf72 TaxID=1736234 RepID=UPI0006F572FA|nr:hypothetical protein [Paenibacillus sp. Leaf72]KQO04300.1 hypothetical protein ASF12_12135 [Paenibacillus sp. Leaf72]